MRSVTTNVANEWTIPGRIERHSEEREYCQVGVISIAVRNARSLRKRTRIAECQAEPECRVVFQSLSCARKGPFDRQGDLPLKIVAGIGCLRIEPYAGLIVADIFAVLIEPAVI